MAKSYGNFAHAYRGGSFNTAQERALNKIRPIVLQDVLVADAAYTTTATAADTLLSLTLASGVWEIEGWLPVTSTANGGVKLNIALRDGMSVGAADQVKFYAFAAAALVTAGGVFGTTGIGTTTAVTSVKFEATITVTNPGSFVLTAAQNASHSDTTTLLAGSRVRAMAVL